MSDDTFRGSMGWHLYNCFHKGSIDGVREKLVLPDAPVDYGDLPDHLFMILFASRVGSTYAGQLLANTPYFDQVSESFNPPALLGARTDQGLADDGEALQWMIRNRGTARAFGVKCGEAGLFSAWHLGFLDAAFDRTKILLLERRDIVAQAVSIFRARLSGRFHSPQAIRQEVRAEQYDRDAISSHIAVIERIYDALRTFLAETGKEYRHIYYEDMCADPAGFVQSVCRDLDLPPTPGFDGKVGVKILRDEINEAWVERYRSGR